MSDFNNVRRCMHITHVSIRPEKFVEQILKWRNLAVCLQDFSVVLACRFGGNDIICYFCNNAMMQYQKRWNYDVNLLSRIAW